MHANNSSITNRYQFILSCVFLRNYALPVTLTFDVRLNNALRAAVITANSEFPRINDFSGHKIFMKIVH